ncbi:MAG: CpsD/CapB family tyrosine-protein kinase [Pseudomonadota bacterium]
MEVDVTMKEPSPSFTEDSAGDGVAPLSSDQWGLREGWLSPDYHKSRRVEIDLLRAAENRCLCLFDNRPETEYYKVLRTQIQQRTRQNGWNTIMVTSVNSGEGTTLTAINLSLTLAKEFSQTVLLVDADLRNQQICRHLGYDSHLGLTDYLERGEAFENIISWPGIEKLTVISGGKTIHNSSEVLGSPRMQSLMTEMKSRYRDRYIIFDLPPVLNHADAVSFAPLVDCIMIIAAAGRTTLEDIHKAQRLFPEEKILGYVLNRYDEIEVPKPKGPPAYGRPRLRSLVPGIFWKRKK